MYKTTKEENEILTKVGPGTPGGEMLRRYWWPVGISGELTTKPTFIRLLGEDLVLFRDGTGRPGVLGAYCAHRRANLCLGDVEKGGLRCRYHGWLYDVTGKVLQTPGEPPETNFRDRVNHLAYPAQELGGLVFTYLGPKPAPLLPRFDLLAGEGEHYAKITGFANCNWLQCVENGMDPLHVSFTHKEGFADLQEEPEIRFEETEWGMVHKAWRNGPKDGTYNYREHHLLMPGISAGGSSGRRLEGATGTPPSGARWSIPIDDTQTMMIRVIYKPADNQGKFDKDPIAAAWKPIRIEPYAEHKHSDNPTLGYQLPGVVATEDAIVMESMPPISDREKENLLPTGDVGMVWLGKMDLRAIETVKAGGDPQGTIRDEAKNHLITLTCYERVISADEHKKMLGLAA